MKASKFHADFESANRAQQWTGNLQTLRIRLENEARRLNGPFVYRVLPHGAWVGMRLHRDGRLEIAIRRRPAPKSQDLPKWENEIATFQKHLGCQQWHRLADMEGIKYGIARHFIEPEKQPTLFTEDPK